MGLTSGLRLKHIPSEGEVLAKTNQREDPEEWDYIGYCIWSLDANRIYDTRMATQLSCSAERLLEEPRRTKENLASKTHTRTTKGGNGAIEEDRTKKVKVRRQGNWKEKKKRRNNRRDKVSRVDHIVQCMIYRSYHPGRGCGWIRPRDDQSTRVIPIKA
jgi:hypothetical protein